jgi:4a-hydroxytetrahydrobiopterin dehydratase
LSEPAKLLSQVPGWRIDEEGHLAKDFDFADFASALAFVNRVGIMADEVCHHPDVLLRWGKVGITVWTHSIGALAVGDFAFAARVEGLVEPVGQL